MDFLAQTTPNPDPTGWVALAIQGGVGTIAVFMLRWIMKLVDTQLKEVKDGQDRMTKEITASNREVAESNDRNGKAQLMLILAMHQVDAGLKEQANALIGKMTTAQETRDRRDKEK